MTRLFQIVAAEIHVILGGLILMYVIGIETPRYIIQMIPDSDCRKTGFSQPNPTQPKCVVVGGIIISCYMYAIKISYL